MKKYYKIRRNGNNCCFSIKMSKYPVFFIISSEFELIIYAQMLYFVLYYEHLGIFNTT